MLENMESITLFPDTVKEEDIANILQDQIYTHKCALLMFLQLSDTECTRYVKLFRDKLERPLCIVVKKDKILLNHDRILLDNTEKLCFIHLYLSKAKIGICFYLDMENGKAFDCVEQNFKWEGRASKYIYIMDPIYGPQVVTG
ncbi:Hypothetical predicted protein [Podarcis lilfordi]|uniref:Uncharacterized protein n=1 Tax=Podarcis lilfordi TaxID=74358 RepID=A0AA35KSF1_9SAUR|nr:Hypothetical predicted protein [Podarcis lilfordi]